jgi:hypothetical protein
MGHEHDDNYYKDKYPEKCGLALLKLLVLWVFEMDLLFL